MSLNRRDRFLATNTMLIARQKAAVARHRANGWGDKLAESLLNELEQSARLARRLQPASQRSCNAVVRQVLNSSFLRSVSLELRDHLQSLMLDRHCLQQSPSSGPTADPGKSQGLDGTMTLMSLLSCDLAMASEMLDEKLIWFLRPHSVGRLLTAIADTLAPIARVAEIEVHIACISEPLQIWCDWDRTLHAMTRLALHVLTATRSGSRISLAARRKHDTVRFAMTTDAAQMTNRDRSPTVQPLSVQVRLASAVIEAQRGRVWSGQVMGRDSDIYIAIPINAPEATAGINS